MNEVEANPIVVRRKRASRIWPKEISCVLISAAQLKRRVRALAEQIERDYAGRDLVILALLKGTVLFLADLIRQVKLPLHLDFIGMSSYRGGVESKDLIFTKKLHIGVKGRDILIVDDILDTGRTMKSITEKNLTAETAQPENLRSPGQAIAQNQSLSTPIISDFASLTPL